MAEKKERENIVRIRLKQSVKTEFDEEKVEIFWNEQIKRTKHLKNEKILHKNTNNYL